MLSYSPLERFDATNRIWNSSFLNLGIGGDGRVYNTRWLSSQISDLTIEWEWERSKSEKIGALHTYLALRVVRAVHVSRVFDNDMCGLQVALSRVGADNRYR